MPGVRHLAVLLDGRHVADLDRTRSGALRLAYAKDARTVGRTPLSLSLPTDSDVYTGTPVETFLQGLVPENPGALDAIARRYGTDTSDVMNVLSAIGQDCAGAVQFCLEDEVERTLRRPGSLERCSDADIEARLDEMDTDENASWTMPGEHWSLGGTQQKFALHRSEGAWYIAHGALPTTHIIKPGVRKMKAQALSEHVSMQVARDLGLDAATTEYRSFKSKEAIVVTRFDRRRVNGPIVRLHQEDLAQALASRHKYEQHGGPSAVDILRLLRAYSETASQAHENVARFVDGLIFNTVIGAPDAHARNFAVLLDGDSVELAPMYDVASGFAYAVSPGSDRVTSMSVGGTFLLDEIDADAWSRFADDADIDAGAVLERVEELTDLAPPSFDHVLLSIEDADGHAVELKRRIHEELAARRTAGRTRKNPR